MKEKIEVFIDHHFDYKERIINKFSNYEIIIAKCTEDDVKTIEENYDKDIEFESLYYPKFTKKSFIAIGKITELKQAYIADLLHSKVIKDDKRFITVYPCPLHKDLYHLTSEIALNCIISSYHPNVNVVIYKKPLESKDGE